MTSLFSIMMLLEAAALVASNPVAQPTITAAPHVKRESYAKRAELTTNDFWTAYYETTDGSGNTFFSSMTNPEDYALVTADTFVYLCDTTQTSWESSCSSSFATSCDGSTEYYLGGSSAACSTSCNADTIFTSDAADAYGLRWVGCVGFEAQTLFYEVEPSTTSSDTSTSTSSTTSSDTNSPTNSPTNSASPKTTPTPSPSPSGTPSPEPEPAPATSKAWVAGPVVGGMAAIALAGAGFFFWRRRKNNAQNPKYEPAPQTGMPSPQPYQSPNMAYQSPNMAHAASPNLPPYGDHAGYYGGQLEGKPDGASVYAHNTPGYAPAEGTMQMPAGVAGHDAALAPGQADASHADRPISELPGNHETQDLPELGSTENRR